MATQLENFFENAKNELISFKNLYPKWYRRFCQNLKDWISQATPINWMELEAQDPFGQLKKNHFLHLIHEFLDKKT